MIMYESYTIISQPYMYVWWVSIVYTISTDTLPSMIIDESTMIGRIICTIGLNHQYDRTDHPYGHVTLNHM